MVRKECKEQKNVLLRSEGEAAGSCVFFCSVSLNRGHDNRLATSKTNDTDSSSICHRIAPQWHFQVSTTALWKETATRRDYMLNVTLDLY